MRRALLVVILAALMGGFAFSGASAAPLQTLTIARPASAAEMMDVAILGPHNSEITGEMVQYVWRTYGIPPHILLSIIGAETSMGDPRFGGRLITEGSHNYGCLKATSRATKWGALANGTIDIGGRVFFTFPSMEIGMMALGRYLKIGPASDPGYYLRCFKRADWYESFAAVYYGRWVPGYWEYVADLRRIDARVCAVARSWGILW